MINRIIRHTLAILFAGSAALHAQDLAIKGFAEGAFGGRVQSNPLLKNKEYTLGETRLQIQFSHFGETAEFYSAFDVLADNVEGAGIEPIVRESFLQFKLGSKADAKIGRQILTWGTGDLLFINDLFPKDYIAFFSGREDQYLKLANDAVKVRFFTPAFDIDLVAIPFFEPDRLPWGNRFSYFNPLAGERVSYVSHPLLPPAAKPEKRIDNGELALRLYRYAGSYQFSGYYFRGFWKTPMAIDMARGLSYYPELTAYGASMRGPLFSGILSLEYGYYDSREDSDGDNPLIPNNQQRYLAGFERQWWTDFTMGFQYYGEYMLNHDAYLRTLPQGAPELDKLRQLFTTRLTQLLHYQHVNLSLFAFYSPTDEDWHLRPSISYRLSDQLSITAGANLFGGNKAYTLFGRDRKSVV